MLSKLLSKKFSSTTKSVNIGETLKIRKRRPRLIDEIKLDFKDVLIRPQLTELKSRKEVNLTRTFNFRHSG